MLKLKHQYFGHLMGRTDSLVKDPDSGRYWREEKEMAEDEIIGWHHRFNGHEFKEAPGVHSDSRPSSQWCHPALSSSVVPFSSCPQSLPASESFPMSQLFASGGQSIGVSASTSVLPMNTHEWSNLGWTGWSPCSPRDSQESSPTPQFKSINSPQVYMCIPVADSFWYLAKLIQLCKV